MGRVGLGGFVNLMTCTQLDPLKKKKKKKQFMTQPDGSGQFWRVHCTLLIAALVTTHIYIYETL